jgi:hypothetical protein
MTHSLFLSYRDPLELPDLRVSVDSVVLLVCPDREASAVSPASPDNWSVPQECYNARTLR